MRRWGLVMFGLVATGDAWAIDPYMWGVGPKVGTTVLPGKFPMKFNETITDDAGLERVGFDLAVGIDSWYYVNGGSRLGATAKVGFGAGFLDTAFAFKYNVVLQSQALDFLFGGGVGAGWMQISGDGDSRLQMPYYPFRVEAATLLRDDTRGYQITVFGEYAVPSTRNYRTVAGDLIDPKDLQGTGVWASLGLEFSVMFGDFEIPRPKKQE